jgi:hypothetical protein
MKLALIGVCGVAIVGLAIIAATDSRAQDVPGDGQIMIAFQRAADSYAFQHRQIERRTGAGDPTAVAAGLKAARATAAEGALFTTQVADAFRRRIATAIRAGGCDRPDLGGASFVVPRVNTSSSGARPLNACLLNALPRLPDELQYRIAGVALLLVDAHNDIVVDVMYAAFSQAGDN